MTEIVRSDPYANASLAERRAYVASIAQAGDLLPRSLWDVTRNPDGSVNPPSPSPAKVLLLAETGSMLGLHPMAALQGIHIIDGKPTLSANLLAAVVRRAGHRLRITTTGSWDAGDFVARAELVRSDDPDFTFVVEWGRSRAERAGLLGRKGPWQNYPEAMAKARAITEVIREGAPDATIVAAYTPEELGAVNVSESGDVVDVGEVPAESTQRSQPKSRKRSPGIMDVSAPPEPQLPAEQESPASMGSFMDAGSEDIQDAEVVDDAPEAQPEPAEQSEPVAQVMDPQPEPRQEIKLVWSKRIAEFCERENPQLHELQALYQEAGAANALGDQVPWIGDPRQGGSNVHDAIMAVRANLEAGREPLAGLA